MYEVIFIITIGIAAYAGASAFRQSVKAQANAAATEEQAGLAAPGPSPGSGLPRLEVEGAIHPAKGEFGFLRHFGLGYAPVYDLCFLPGPLSKDGLSPSVLATLGQMHEYGDAVGSDVMEFLHHGKSLTKSEVLCFALLANPNQPGPRIVAFVDKARFQLQN